MKNMSKDQLETATKHMEVLAEEFRNAETKKINYLGLASEVSMIMDLYANHETYELHHQMIELAEVYNDL